MSAHKKKDDSGGKQELEEVVDNLRHWKDNCNALGYDSDGEQLSLATTADGSEGGDEATKRRAEASRNTCFDKTVGRAPCFSRSTALTGIVWEVLGGLGVGRGIRKNNRLLTPVLDVFARGKEKFRQVAEGVRSTGIDCVFRSAWHGNIMGAEARDNATDTCDLENANALSERGD